MKSELFKKQIIDSDRLSYVQQIYDVMCREIHCGRWKEGDRLPGVKELADQSNQMIKTVQTVYKMLNKDGYIMSLDRKGTYLVSQLPKNRKSKGIIGILISEEQESEHVSKYYMHDLLSESVKHGFFTEVKTVKAEASFRSYQEICGLFGKDLKGVIFLYPFTFPPEFIRPSIPRVYLCQQQEKCYPLVAVDVYHAFYELTSRIIDMGHENIIFCKESPVNASRFFPKNEIIVEAWARAMSDAGLRASPVKSINIRPNDYAELEEFIDNNAKNCTAIISNTVFLSCAIASLCKKKNIKVPGDISVASIGSLPIWETDGKEVTGGMVQDDHFLAQTCFNRLVEQFEKGTYAISKILLKPEFFPGNSVAERRMKIKK